MNKMSKKLIKKILVVLLALCLVRFLYNEYHKTRIAHERQNIGPASMLYTGSKGNMSWILDLVRNMNPENSARKQFISAIDNQRMNTNILKALHSSIAPQQKTILK